MTAVLSTACSSPPRTAAEPTSPASASADPSVSAPTTDRPGPVDIAARRLHIPHAASGAACPVTRQWSSREEANLPGGILHIPLLGSGPVYPGVYTNLAKWRREVAFQMVHPAQPAVPLRRGWLVQKVLWGVSRGYRGPVLIRGHQVDGQGRMLFYTDHSQPRLRFSGRVGDHPSEVLVTAPGCYGWQLDGRGFSEVLVFEAVRHSLGS